jgi:high-affinity Fe2+/Pb2+ permease
MPDLSHVNWALWIVVGLALTVGWTILRFVLRLTMRMFALGCVGLIILAALVVAVSYFTTH